MSTNIEEMTTEELEQLLEKKRKQQRDQREREKKKYEEDRDLIVELLITKAERLAAEMAAFKQECHEAMADQEIKLQNYGKIPGKSKGGFSVTHSNSEIRVTRRRDTEPTWDERANKAEALIKDFLGDKIKSRNKDLFEILMGFLQRNQNGDLEFAKVFGLLKHRNKFDDPRWVEGLQLLEDSYGVHLKGFGYEFKKTGEDGKWKSILLNFSAL